MMSGWDLAHDVRSGCSGEMDTSLTSEKHDGTDEAIPFATRTYVSCNEVAG